MMNKYIGHENQIYGVEEVRLYGGKGDGMRFLIVRNGSGLEFTISLDRCADLSRVTFKGVNYGYFAPCGYVSPKYYDDKGLGFLKSFTAGFLTTCGLTSVGNPCTDEGEELPLHGTVSHIPCENVSYYIKDNEIYINALIRDARLGGHKLLLERTYRAPLFKNELYISDTVKNIGSDSCPFQLLYHCNLGYPLLSENAVFTIPSIDVKPRNEHAATDIENCLNIEKPQNGYEEMCFYHTLKDYTTVSLFNPDIQKGIKMSYDTNDLPCFTEWKMMGEYEYVLGIEPGNCYPDGRHIMRESGMLTLLEAGEEKNQQLKFEFTEE